MQEKKAFLSLRGDYNPMAEWDDFCLPDDVLAAMADLVQQPQPPQPSMFASFAPAGPLAPPPVALPPAAMSRGPGAPGLENCAA